MSAPLHGQDPLDWVLSLPPLDDNRTGEAVTLPAVPFKVTEKSADTVSKSVTLDDGWTVVVTPNPNGTYRVAARRGAQIIVDPKVSESQLKSWTPKF